MDFSSLGLVLVFVNLCWKCSTFCDGRDNAKASFGLRISENIRRQGCVRCNLFRAHHVTVINACKITCLSWCSLYKVCVGLCLCPSIQITLEITVFVSRLCGSATQQQHCSFERDWMMLRTSDLFQRVEASTSDHSTD